MINTWFRPNSHQRPQTLHKNIRAVPHSFGRDKILVTFQPLRSWFFKPVFLPNLNVTHKKNSIHNISINMKECYYKDFCLLHDTTCRLWPLLHADTLRVNLVLTIQKRCATKVKQNLSSGIDLKGLCCLSIHFSIIGTWN